MIVQTVKQDKRMKVTIANAVAFFIALKFEKAGDWTIEQIEQRLNQVPTKVPRNKVPEAHLDFYDRLEKNAGKVKVVADEVAAPEAKPEKADKGEKAEKPSKSKKKKDRAQRGTKKVDKVAKATKATVSPKSAPKTVKRDEFGCAEGSISAKVNAVLSDTFQTEQEIAKAAGVTLDQARGRLYYAAEEGIIQYEKRIQYRLAPKSKKDEKAEGKSKKK